MVKTERPRARAVAGAIFALALATTAACGRSGSDGGSSTPSLSSGGGSSSAVPSASTAGNFGTLKGVCGPGQPSGATGRGVTDKQIRIATNADASSPASPGLGQEFFDVGEGFVKWCNAAGGINGRQIVLDKLDAKLFNVGQIMTKACQSDFMMVGGGNPADGVGVKIREACKLGYMPAYTASTEAGSAKYQVTAFPLPPDKLNVGGARLLTELYPESKQGVAYGGLNIASIVSTGKRVNEALTQLGIKVTTQQIRPPVVANFRPYMEELKGNGSVGLYELGGANALPEVQGMNDVGYKPAWMLLGPQFFNQQTVKAAGAATFPPTYNQIQHLPFELANKYPVMAEAKSIITAVAPDSQLDDFNAGSLDAWLLWAKAATACGSTLTVDCVLEKAGSETAWTAGGMFPAAKVTPGSVEESPCMINMRLTPDGWVYDEKATQPDKDAYNCDPANLRTTQIYQ